MNYLKLDKILEASYINKFYDFADFQKEQIKKACSILIDCFYKGNKALFCGNGGSAADASHMACELIKDFKIKTTWSNEKIKNEFSKTNYSVYIQKGFPVFSLNDNATMITAIANDMGSDYIFSQQVYNLGKEKDVLVVFSTSGKSMNINMACEFACKIKKMKVVYFTGCYDTKIFDGKGYKYINYVRSKYNETADVQEEHIKMYHLICKVIEEYFYGNVI